VEAAFEKKQPRSAVFPWEERHFKKRKRKKERNAVSKERRGNGTVHWEVAIIAKVSDVGSTLNVRTQKEESGPFTSIDILKSALLCRLKGELFLNRSKSFMAEGREKTGGSHYR